MWINVFLFLITLAAFWQTKRSVDIAKDAMTAQQRQTAIDNRRNDANFALQQQALQTQIDAVNESREQFRKANTPLVEFGVFTIYPLRTDTNIVIKFSIKNMNNFTIQLVEFKVTVQVGNQVYTTIGKSDKYVLNSNPYEGIITTNIYPTTATVDSILYHYKPISVSGYIIYKDVPTNKMRVNKYKINAYEDYTGLQTSDFIYSKNEDFIK